MYREPWAQAVPTAFLYTAEAAYVITECWRANKILWRRADLRQYRLPDRARRQSRAGRRQWRRQEHGDEDHRRDRVGYPWRHSYGAWHTGCLPGSGSPVRQPAHAARRDACLAGAPPRAPA